MKRVSRVAMICCAVACGSAPKHVEEPKAAAGVDLPFESPATVEPASGEQKASLFGVTLAVKLRREVTSDERLAFVVRVGDLEVGRYPIQGNSPHTTQDLQLPLGDYHLELIYNGAHYAGPDFRI